MRTRVLGPVVLGIILVALLLPPATAAASTDAAREQVVNGAFVVAINPDSVTVVPTGQTCHIGLIATFTLAGGLDGAFTAPFAILHLGPCDQPAAEVFTARGTFSGAAAGLSGSFDFLFIGTIDAKGHADGQLVIVHGAGGLGGLRGAIRLTGQSGVGGSYSGTLVQR